MTLNMQNNYENQVVPLKSVKNKSNSEKDKSRAKQILRDEHKKEILHEIFMFFVKSTRLFVVLFFISFVTIWVLRCIAITDNKWDMCILMFDDIKSFSSYLLTVIISIFITHIIDKK